MSLSDVSRKCVMIARRTCSSFSFYFLFCSFYFSLGSLHHLSHKSRHIKSSIRIHLYFHCRLANICVMIIIWQTEFASYTRSICATVRQWGRQSNTSHRAYARHRHMNSFRRLLAVRESIAMTLRLSQHEWFVLFRVFEFNEEQRWEFRISSSFGVTRKATSNEIFFWKLRRQLATIHCDVSLGVEYSKRNGWAVRRGQHRVVKHNGGMLQICTM